MKKEFNRNDLAAIKRAAANIAPLAAKRDKITEKIEKLLKERAVFEEQIANYNSPTLNMTGYNVEDLVVRDEDKKFVFKYPETIIPNLITEDTEPVETIDETAVVEEVETAPAEAPIDLPY